MLLFTKIVHVLAMGLWFGSVIFFSFVVGLSLFSTFEHLSEKPAAERPWWLPLPPEVAKEQGPSEKFPRPLSKEQGSRIAGVAVGPMFGWYYAIQLVCGVLAVATALAWWSGGDTLSRVRIGILLAALISVGVGWWLEHKVSDLRVTRSDASDAVLTAAQASPESIVAANAARADFGRWHGYSLIVNFVTVALVLAGMVLVALLPAGAADGPAAVVKEEVVSAAHSGAE